MSGLEISKGLAAGALGVLLMYLVMRCFDWWTTRHMMKERVCRYCGCSDDRACPGGCWWVAEDVCSACASAMCTWVSKVDEAKPKAESNLRFFTGRDPGDETD